MAAEEVELDHVKKEESSAEDGPADRVVPPDGGWGWVVMMVIIHFTFYYKFKSFNQSLSSTARQ